MKRIIRNCCKYHKMDLQQFPEKPDIIRFFLSKKQILTR